MGWGVRELARAIRDLTGLKLTDLLHSTKGPP